MSFEVQKKQCATCIYRPDSLLDVGELERQIEDPNCPGFFRSYRICHHSQTACCRGFWARHRWDFQLGQLAQRFGLVEYVEHDELREEG